MDRSYLTMLGAVLLLVSGCSGNDATSFRVFTQCLDAIGGHEHTYREALYEDPERGCYGVRWKIPRVLLAGTSPMYGEFRESMWITVDEDRRRMLLERGLQHWVPPVTFLRTKLQPISPNRRERMARSLGTYEMGMRLVEVEPRFGMTVKKSTIPKHTEDILLHPPSDPTFYVLCRPVPDGRGAPYVERTNCQVRNMFTEYLELEYVVPYADLARLDTINTEMIAWIRQFIGH
jgi:hypothetical protein